ncbi:5397_t:CDS:2 [Funneliformis caledonium]|uniref:5397_t:CDS:1 n=1 Tax=Funneliformis caledonium TaxID=1117310 RepID=A0A9N9EC53_9GLOM|nr:5397_t:CDS:2 [Funneliformis caledonium]
MYASNSPPPDASYTSVNPSMKTSVISKVSGIEPYVSHIVQNVTRDLEFLRQQGCISSIAFDEIVERLPKPIFHAAPHTPPPAPSPTSPVRSESSDVSVKSDTSKKHNSITSIPQRPLSASSQISQEQPMYPSVQQKLEDDENQRQSQQISAQLRSISPFRETPPLLSTPPPLPHLMQNREVRIPDQSQIEYQSIMSRPDLPSRVSSSQQVGHHSQPSSAASSISNTGAIIATRPLPHPPNSSGSSPPCPQVLPVFNNKQEEAEYEKSMNRKPKRESVLPAYSISLVEALWDFRDLSFRKGDIIEVVEYVNMDWWKGRIRGTDKIGIFPKIYTRVLPGQVANNNTVPEQPMVTNVYYSQRPNNMSTYSSQSIRPAFQPSISSTQIISNQSPSGSQHSPSIMAMQGIVQLHCLVSKFTIKCEEI